MATDGIALTAEEAGFAARRRAFVDGLFFRVVACFFLEVVVLTTALPSGVPLLRFLPALGVSLAVPDGKRGGLPACPGTDQFPVPTDI